MSSVSDRERLRAEHGVRIVEDKEEGTGVNDLPGGVYGFTYAPVAEAPLFATPSNDSFEIHKMADGSARVLCYVEPEQKAQVYENRGDLKLYPAPFEKSTELVVVRSEDIGRPANRVLREPGNPIKAHLG